MTAAKKKSVDFLRERARTLKRLLVHRSPLMPTGLLIFCLEYAAKETEPLPGIFASVRARFGELAVTQLKTLLESCYEFRNTYIAHEKQDGLHDPELARQALTVWAQTLCALCAALRRVAVWHG